MPVSFFHAWTIVGKVVPIRHDPFLQPAQTYIGACDSQGTMLQNTYPPSPPLPSPSSIFGARTHYAGVPVFVLKGRGVSAKHFPHSADAVSSSTSARHLILRVVEKNVGREVRFYREANPDKVNHDIQAWHDDNRTHTRTMLLPPFKEPK
jgi:hypothetical protein